MKRKSRLKQLNFERIRIRRFKKRLIRAAIAAGKIEKIPPEMRRTINLVAPEVLSFKSNFTETVNFLHRVRELSLVSATRKKIVPNYFCNYSIQLRNLKTLSVRAAVVFTAEMDRLQRLGESRLAYGGKIDEDDGPISVLRQLGFFEFLGISSKSDSEPKGRALIPILSGLKCEERKFVHFEASVKQICSEYRTLAVVHEGMAEAMLNVVHHAYMPEISLKYPTAGKRWWATACHNPGEREIKILIFDQGHGIANTLPTSGFKELVLSSVSELTRGAISDDALLLEAALAYARSRTNQVGRGKGFRNITKPVEELNGATLRILSGRAEVTYIEKDVIETKSHPHHIGGTLIEWAFPVSDFV